ncbi:hypothetical protein PQ472_07360 [Lacticaseibacillus pabuli]|uniref:Uncharacterized protein n=1 Tax=Lacticaseibacillus pabuli TaxID=3025672 RepID=A0ABY7WRS0_9LACO|nr:hypothetical protein [Lacticaseibacillus sp. KACC 23028]WDF81744.1 hypothetical protein PQ472_07360 [Lacticaseibacillus sp. KACC 23028]
MLLPIVMSVYGILLLAVSWYLLAHRGRSFLMFNQPSGDLSASMLVTSIAEIICAVAGVIVGFMQLKWIALVVIAISLLFIMLFASGLTRAMGK